jgi:hypothetical protein
MSIETAFLGAVVRFPMRKSPAVWIIPDPDDPASWLVVAHGHGWLFGSKNAADEDAQWLGRNLGLPVRATS